MENLSDRLLIEAYCKAVELQLEGEFLVLIKKELNYRALADESL